MVVVRGGDGNEHCLREGADATGFVVDDVAALIADHAVWGLKEVRTQRDLIAHGAGHD
jgi:hypothetical protein